MSEKKGNLICPTCQWWDRCGARNTVQAECTDYKVAEAAPRCPAPDVHHFRARNARITVEFEAETELDRAVARWGKLTESARERVCDTLCSVCGGEAALGNYGVALEAMRKERDEALVAYDELYALNGRVYDERDRYHRDGELLREWVVELGKERGELRARVVQLETAINKAMETAGFRWSEWGERALAVCETLENATAPTPGADAKGGE